MSQKPLPFVRTMTAKKSVASYLKRSCCKTLWPFRYEYDTNGYSVAQLWDGMDRDGASFLAS